MKNQIIDLLGIKKVDSFYSLFFQQIAGSEKIIFGAFVIK